MTISLEFKQKNPLSFLKTFNEKEGYMNKLSGNVYIYIWLVATHDKYIIIIEKIFYNFNDTIFYLYIF